MRAILARSTTAAVCFQSASLTRNVLTSMPSFFAASGSDVTSLKPSNGLVGRLLNPRSAGGVTSLVPVKRAVKTTGMAQSPHEISALPLALPVSDPPATVTSKVS